MKAGLIDMGRTAILTVTCAAPTEFFLPEWDDIPPEMQKLITENNGLPCEVVGASDGAGWRTNWNRIETKPN